MSGAILTSLRRVKFLWLPAVCGLSLCLVQCQAQGDQSPTAGGMSLEMLDAMPSFPGGLSALPQSPPIPVDNPQTADKIQLGKELFFDKRLSGDRSLSCATCHDPQKSFSDGRPKALGLGNRALLRHSQSVLNAAYNPLQFWDGRAGSLEDQAAVPMLSAIEMGASSQDALVSRLQNVPGYREAFQRAFGGDVNFRAVVQALAAFERTLVTPDSPFDRYMRGNKRALDDQQKRGLILFLGKASCTQCHSGPNFTDSKFHSLGKMPGEEQTRDLGRFAITHDPVDNGAFKTPSLRNLTGRGPYMHNGSIATLAEVISLYNRGGGEGEKSDLIAPLNLTASEEADLEVFLHSLDGTVPLIQTPELPADAP
jgi:cytochrome c peroxidase